MILLDSVVPSGFTVDTSVTFVAFSNLLQNVSSMMISDDDYALETVEAFNISLTSSNPSSSNVILGESSTVQIIDDDGVFSSFATLKLQFTFSFTTADVTVVFVNETYRFSEGDSGMIELQLTRGVAQNVTVAVNGGKIIQCACRTLIDILLFA